MSDDTTTKAAGPDRIGQLAGIVVGLAVGWLVASRAVADNGNSLFGAGLLGVILGAAVGFLIWKFVGALRSFLSGEMIEDFERVSRQQDQADAARKAAMAARRAAGRPAAPAPEKAAAPEATAQSRPAGSDAPREGGRDDLQRIKGVGPKLEAMLNAMGYWHFDQIAAWTEAEIAWIDANIEGVKGRASRDDWAAQARALTAEG